jgi:hypothetical protein
MNQDDQEDKDASSDEKPAKIPIEETPKPIIAEEQNTENMEVHYHPHLSHGEKKKFKAYLSEFLMIFLAVTMGFIAENIREHITEHTKEKEYIHSFVEHLKSDTASMKETIAVNKNILTGLDSIIALAKKDMANDIDRRSFYHLTSKYLSNYSVFKANDNVMQQLKYSGDLRVIRKAHIADSLVSYDEVSKAVYDQGQIAANLFKEATDLQEEVIDFSTLTDKSYFKTNGTARPLPLIVAGDAKMRLFFNKIIVYKWVLSFYNAQLLPENLAAAKNLIKSLRNVYDLEGG